MATHPNLNRRTLGSTSLEVTPLSVGTSALASMPDLYGYGVGEEQAIETVMAALASPINVIDTSNGYGADGESEMRIGEAIRRSGGVPRHYLIATKVDPDPVTGDFSGARVRASLDESMERLGLDHLEVVHLHDPERMSFEEGVARGGPLEALIAAREEGLVDFIGVAGGPVGLLGQYLDTGSIDVLLSHNRFTLLDRSAQPLFEEAARRGVGVMNAAPYGGGMLVKGPDAQPRYAYGERPDLIREQAAEMLSACRRHDVPLAAAALQFSTTNPLIDSTVIGMSSPERIDQTIELSSIVIPDDLWRELEVLVPPPSTWLDRPSL